MNRDETPVLVIDDDAVSRELLLLLLRRHGYPVKTADSGAQALEYLRTQGSIFPRVVLADLQMPGISGERLARALRELCGGEPILVAMSGSPPDEAACQEYEAFLLKPFTTDQFAAVIAGRNASSTAEPRHEQAVVLDRTVFDNLAAAMSPQQLDRLYSLCLEDTAKRVAAMREAASKNDDVSYKKQAHAIKGGCGMVGALEMQTLATTMENKGLAANHVATLQEFLMACERLRGMLNAREAAVR
jgi:CheY-like chemotaxis protein